VADLNDRCPREKEDVDGFQDADGCAEPDNDGDGILDRDDKCANEPETVNGVDDMDGCPTSRSRAGRTWARTGSSWRASASSSSTRGARGSPRRR
jgi:hypothetical protein